MLEGPRELARHRRLDARPARRADRSARERPRRRGLRAGGLPVLGRGARAGRARAPGRYPARACGGGACLPGGRPPPRARARLVQAHAAAARGRGRARRRERGGAERRRSRREGGRGRPGGRGRARRAARRPRAGCADPRRAHPPRERGRSRVGGLGDARGARRGRRLRAHGNDTRPRSRRSRRRHRGARGARPGRGPPPRAGPPAPAALARGPRAGVGDVGPGGAGRHRLAARHPPNCRSRKASTIRSRRMWPRSSAWCSRATRARSCKACERTTTGECPGSRRRRGSWGPRRRARLSRSAPRLRPTTSAAGPVRSSSSGCRSARRDRAEPHRRRGVHHSRREHDPGAPRRAGRRRVQAEPCGGDPRFRADDPAPLPRRHGGDLRDPRGRGRDGRRRRADRCSPR